MVSANLENYRRGLHHSIVVQKVRGQNSLYVPVLYLDETDEAGGSEPIPLHVLTDYFVSRSAYSLRWMRLCARGVGLFYDYVRQRRAYFDVVAKDPNGSVHETALSEFQNHLWRGTIVDGVDETGLYWSARLSADIVVDLCRGIEEFINWTRGSRHGDRLEHGLADFQAPSSGKQLMHLLYVARFQKALSFLGHIDQGKRTETPFDRSIVGPDRRDWYRSDGTVRFPVHYLVPLFERGFISRPKAKEDWQRENMTAKLASMLCAFGGLRRSEPLHIWVDDVQWVDGRAVVFLHDPNATTKFNSAKMTRAEFLRDHCGLDSRDKMAGQLHAGWKGIKCNKDLWAPVFFLPFEGLNEWFWETYQTYMRFVRPRLMRKRIERGFKDHPFLLVSSGDSHQGDDEQPIGSPYSHGAHGKAWEQAINRLAAIYPEDETLIVRKALGTTLHGLRHLYGGVLGELGIGEKLIQECMHHLSPLSSLTYTKPRDEFVDKNLREGAHRIRSAVAGEQIPTMVPEASPIFRDLGTMLEDLRSLARGRGW
ncbi:hypothetical protein [Methylosinus sp. KRF6]|uniref:hypothetical protein n=1 Tax=Methylosinus sp. KRF6 TaxID=2846853 RepID=UPI001C0AA4A7|nr:hypothetical protein [Methylosinus sp. KRF6]MBU3891006.1 hypothetical protein [Methylosinus sp. KRF6]